MEKMIHNLVLLKQSQLHDNYIYICQHNYMDGVRRRGSKTSRSPYQSYRYEYSQGKRIPIREETENTPRSAIMEGEDIG